MRIIACGSKKKTELSEAQDLYIGSLFNLAKAWAKQSPDGKWAILSAKLGLVYPNEYIYPYDYTFKKAPSGWGERVLKRMPLDNNYEIAVPKRYLEPLLGKREIVNVLSGCSGIGYQMQRLKELTKCNK